MNEMTEKNTIVDFLLPPQTGSCPSQVPTFGSLLDCTQVSDSPPKSLNIQSLQLKVAIVPPLYRPLTAGLLYLVLPYVNTYGLHIPTIKIILLNNMCLGKKKFLN